MIRFLPARPPKGRVGVYEQKRTAFRKELRCATIVSVSLKKANDARSFSLFYDPKAERFIEVNGNGAIGLGVQNSLFEALPFEIMEHRQDDRLP